ncbi:MAG: GAF domain-containing protein [Fimbriimonadales bacterium]
MDTVVQLRKLLEQVSLSHDATTLYTVCENAVTMTGARNAMIADFNAEQGYMTLRAGIGEDWSPNLLGEQINIGDEQNEGITAYVAATGTSYLSSDVRVESRYRRLIEGTRSELASPIRDADARMRGVLNAESDETAKFDDLDKENLELLAVIAGIVLDREDSRITEEALFQIVTALDQAKTEEDLLKRVASVTQKVLRVSAYSIFLWDERAQAFVLNDTVGSSTLAPEAQYLAGEGCTGWVCEHCEPVRLSDPSKDPRWRGRFLEFPREEIKSFLAVPITSGGTALGCMRALRKKASNPFIDNRFTEGDERLLMAIAEQLGAGLQKLRGMRKLINSERMAAWGELSAKSSHMIGNRVFALKGDLNELKHLLSKPELARNSIANITESLEKGIGRLDEILHEFRDFVTATKLNEEVADINAVARDAANALIPETSPVKLKLDLAGNIDSFKFDPKKIERAISELVENALHFVERGEIALRTRVATPEDLRRAKWDPRGLEHVLIEVEDQGPGVATGSKESIFMPYKSSRPRGMGLGLSIVKGIIDAHGGKLYESGEEGKGARFTILLPIPESAQSSSV